MKVGIFNIFGLKANLCGKKELFRIPSQCIVSNSSLFCYGLNGINEERPSNVGDNTRHRKIMFRS